MMPMVVVVLVVLALFYQLFFRYETYESDKKPGIMVERDTLTGDEKVLKTGTKISVMGRLWGNGDSSADGESQLRPWNAGEDGEKPQEASAEDANNQRIDFNDHQLVEKVARPVPVPREVVVASSAPPVPMSGLGGDAHEADSDDAARPFAIRQVDLNKDGTTEEIIQNATQPDGLLDISIVKNGREIFFGRGKQISLLPSRNQGWSDIVLKMGYKTLQVFRYDPKESAYRAMDSKS